jgi:hypothetical protein
VGVDADRGVFRDLVAEAEGQVVAPDDRLGRALVGDVNAGAVAAGLVAFQMPSWVLFVVVR